MCLFSSYNFLSLRLVTSPSSHLGQYILSRQIAVAIWSWPDQKTTQTQHLALPKQDLFTPSQEMSRSQEWLFPGSQTRSHSWRVVFPRRLLWLGLFLQGSLCFHYFLAHIWLVKIFISQGHKLPWQLLGKLAPFVSCSFPLCPSPLIKPAEF